MNKIDISFGPYWYILCILSVLAFLFVKTHYQKTKPQPKQMVLWMLICLRSLTIILLLILIFDPSIKFYTKQTHIPNLTIYKDLSASMKPYTLELNLKIDSLKEAYSSSYNITEIEINKDELETDFISYLNKINDLENNVKNILLTDGNQTINKRLNYSSSLSNLTIIPIGNPRPKTDYSIDIVTDKKSYPINNQNEISVKISSITQSSIKVNIDDSTYILSNFNTSLKNHIVKVPFKFSQEKTVRIHAELLTENENVKKSAIIKLEDKRTKIIHLFTAPNIDAKFFSILLDNSKIKRQYIETFDFNTLKLYDLIIVSDIDKIKNKNVLTILSKNLNELNQPLIIFQSNKTQLDFRNLTSIEFSTQQINKQIRLNRNLPADLASFFSRKENEFLDNFPKIKATNLKSNTQLLPIFEDMLFISKDRRTMLFNTIDFWKVHMETQQNLYNSTFYKNFVNYFTQILIKGSSNPISSNINSLEFISNTRREIHLSVKHQDATLKYDNIQVVIKNDKKEIYRKIFNSNNQHLYSFNFDTPSKGNLNFSIETNLNNKPQFRKNFLSTIKQISTEESMKYINIDLLNHISEKLGSKINRSVKSIHFDTNNINSSNIISNYYNLNSSTFFLVFIVLFISTEWLLRKLNNLL